MEWNMHQKKSKIKTTKYIYSHSLCLLNLPINNFLRMNNERKEERRQEILYFISTIHSKNLNNSEYTDLKTTITMVYQSVVGK